LHSTSAINIGGPNAAKKDNIIRQAIEVDAGLVALASDLMQSSEQRLQFVEVLQARDIFRADLLTFLPGHAGHYARRREPRNATFGLFVPVCNARSNYRAEQDWHRVENRRRAWRGGQMW
jgi:hypothetical protein